MTALEDCILEILKSQSGWRTRKEIATLLNRPKSVLNPHDKHVLDKLISIGKVEKRLHVVKTVKAEWRYKAK